MAALDPCLMTGLPAPITAATGMDALTHAVEAYIGLWSTEFTDRMALAAVAMIYRNLPLAFADGEDLAAREQMALASTFAGLAFTRANVVNVHAIAHQLGGRYHTHHGLANAIMLGPVLRFCAEAIPAKLAVLALRAGVGRPGEPEAELAQKFLDSVAILNRSLGIPRQLDALREQDIPELAKAACWEADTNYPVPRVIAGGVPGLAAGGPPGDGETPVGCKEKADPDEGSGPQGARRPLSDLQRCALQREAPSGGAAAARNLRISSSASPASGNSGLKICQAWTTWLQVCSCTGEPAARARFT